MRKKYMFLPTARNNVAPDSLKPETAKPDEQKVVGDSPCPCCGSITIPNGGDALAYICPVCFWEIDLFITSENEPSDQNHGLTLVQARENYKKFGAVLERLVQYTRRPTEDEIPNKNK